MPLPNFLGIGGQKCGTTWLHHLLAHHPDAFVPKKIKEICYFDSKARKIKWSDYEAFFTDATQVKAIGEITPTYLWVSQEHDEWGAPNDFRNKIPERVMDALGNDLKLVVLLRNPVHRTISAYLHNIKMKRIPHGEQIAPWLDKFGIVHFGFWGAHLARWAEIYDKKNFFVTSYEELFSNHQILEDLLEFLGLNFPDWLKEKFDDMHQTSFPYSRHGDRFTFDDGTLIASNEDVQKLRDIFREDVIRLKNDWDLPENLWADEFSN